MIRKPRRRKGIATRSSPFKIRRSAMKAKRIPKARRLMKEAPPSLWGERAYAAGYAAAVERSPAVEKDSSIDHPDPHRQVNACWNQWYRTIQRMPWQSYHQLASKFRAGYCRHKEWHSGNWVLVPSAKKVAAIVSIMNEKETILSILEQLHRLPLHEIIFIVNGSTDESFECIRNHSQATIVYYHDPLGHDVGRAVGAKLADSEILLFLDGDFTVHAEQLVPFIDSVDQGMDIALNNIAPYIGIFSNRDEVTTVKEFVNQSMARTDLGANSLTAVPHAMTKQAAEQIGYANLAVPPKAQVIAIDMGLKISTPTSVNVITRNRIRAGNVGHNNKISELIIGDHIEALKVVLDMNGSRLSFPDQIRQRKLT